MEVSDKQTDQNSQDAHHRFVKTTPNPSATKNKSGELVGLLFDVDVDVDVGDWVGDVVVVDIEVGVAAVDEGSIVVCLPTIFKTSTIPLTTDIFA